MTGPATATQINRSCLQQSNPMGWSLNAKPFFLNSDQYFQSKFLLFLPKKKFGEIIFFVSCKIFSFSLAASFLFIFLSDLIWRRKSIRPTFLKWGSRWPEAKSMSALRVRPHPHLLRQVAKLARSHHWESAEVRIRQTKINDLVHASKEA